MRYKERKNYRWRDITKRDYLLAICKGLGLLMLFSYLFYGTVLTTIIGSPYLIWYIKSWKKQYIKKKKWEFQLQFKDGIQSLSTALSVGYSLENAVHEAYEDLRRLYRRDARILYEFRYMLHQLDMNLPMETIWKELAARTEDKEVQTFVTVFVMAKRSGGDMVGIIRNAITCIGETIDVQRKIEVLLSAKRLEFRVMSVIPVCMIFYMKVSFPEFMRVLYGNVVGIAVMTICLAIYVAALELGKRIIEIEV